MSTPTEIVVTIPSGRRVDAQIGAHTLRTDQPRDNGGEDSAPSPFDVFLGSMGACAGIFVQGFCAKRNIPTEGIRIIERPSYNAEGVLCEVEFDVQLPAGFPEKYKDAVVKVIDGCSVKKAIAAQPTFKVHASVGADPGKAA